MVQVEKPLFTVEEYYKMFEEGILKRDDRLELIGGEIIKMSPIRSLHSAVVDDLHELLILSLKGRFITKSQNPVQISEYSEPEPDIFVVKFREDKYRSHHPRREDVLLIIEVADTSLAFDRDIMKLLYAEAGIPEYWIVNLIDQQVEVFKNPQKGDYLDQNIVKRGNAVRNATIDFNLNTKKIFF